MSNGGRPQQRKLTPEEMAQFQEADRQWRLEYMPPQVDVNGMERQCVHCKSVLNPLHNRNYDGSTGGFCGKLCRKGYEADVEIEKYENWKPKKHSPVAV